MTTFEEARAACVERWGEPSWADAGALPRAAWSWGRGASRVMLIGQPGRLRLDLTDDDAESVGEPWQQWTITSEAAMTAVIARAGEYMATHGGEPVPRPT